MTRRIALPRWWPLLLLMPTGFLLARRHSAAASFAEAKPSTAVAVFAGGCYWGVESVFQHVRGVHSAISGFATPATAARGTFARPAEAVRITHDPSEISYRQILDIFFSVVHDPTELNRQGPDVGPQYRSIVFVESGRQRRAVRAYIDSLGAARVFSRKIVTEIAELQSFQAVAASQQDYAARHPTDPYIVTNDAPKLEALHRRFPRLYRN